MAPGPVYYFLLMPGESERENQVPNHATSVFILRAMILSPLLVELQWPEKCHALIYLSH